MTADKALYQVSIKDIDFKNMPNDEEFYFVIDLAYGKRVHRCGHIKANPNNFRFVLLEKSQLTENETELSDLQKAEATVEFMNLFRQMLNVARMFSWDERSFRGCLIEDIDKKIQKAEEFIEKNKK